MNFSLGAYFLQNRIYWDRQLEMQDVSEWVPQLQLVDKWVHQHFSYSLLSDC